MNDKTPVEKEITLDMFEMLMSQPIVVLRVKQGSYSDKADYVASNLREADYKEVMRSGGRCPRKMINNSWKLAGARWIIFFNQEPVALFGVVKGENRIGIPWMVATDSFNNTTMERYFIKNCAKYIDEMFKSGDYLLLQNCIDVDNESSLRWLEWCGFHMDDIINHGPDKSKFQMFSMARRVH